jgi:hypothetical protein
MANTYPFITKSQIAAQLDKEPDFVVDCMRVMQHRHQVRLSGAVTSGGWMASHAKTATQLAAKIACGESTPGDIGKARKLLHRYVKQITSHFRSEQIRTNPELAELARLFGVAAPVAPAPVVPMTVVETAPVEVAEPANGSEDDGLTGNEDDDDGDDTETADEQDELTAGAVTMTLRVEPNLRSEEISERISISTALLAPTLRLMVEAGKLQKSGNGRGTRYRLPE